MLGQRLLCPVRSDVPRGERVPSQPTPVRRALEGVSDFTGRTLVIAGPPASGKSKLLRALREALAAKGARIVQIQGSYRGRSTPYGALDGLRGRAEEDVASGGGESTSGDGGPEGIPLGPMAPIAQDPERMPSRRRGRGERGRGSVLGPPMRSRSANIGDPDGYWRGIVPEFRGPKGHPIGLLVEDAALFDQESREFVVALTKKARLRPFLIAIALDTSVPGSSLWEEALFGRGDVDWIRTTSSAPDPREELRLRGLFEGLPPAARRIAGFVSMLGGSVGDVVLSRVSRLNFSQLAEALLPASEVGLLKSVEGKVTMPHREWISLTPEFLPEAERREMHRQIADALSALSPEPSLARRIEVARHYLEGDPGPVAMSRLLEAAEISIQLLSYDTATDLLTDAMGCLAGLAPEDRRPIEPEMRLLYAQALFFSGRLTDAETQVREGIDWALKSGAPAAELGEWVEPLLLTLRAVGPRPSLTTTLVELAERCHDARLIEVEVLLETVIAEYYRERKQAEKAQIEALRAAALARGLPDRHLQALGLLATGLSQIEGTAENRLLAARFLKAARILLGRARRWELDYLAGEYEARLLEADGNFARAKVFRERSVATLQREKLLSVELGHDLGIAQLLLDEGTTKGRDVVLARARSVAETLHLVPPSPYLLHLWLLDGRQLALAGLVDAAKDRWEAIIDLPPAASLPGPRAEAMVRLALLNYAVGRPDEARALGDRLASVDLISAFPSAWQSWLPDLERLAPDSGRGGVRLPPTPASDEPLAAEERERTRN
jgi:energy-coupling factor transporter ATP-binding protein EcfA2